MTWFEVPDADRMEQELDVMGGDGDDRFDERWAFQGALPIEAPIDDVLEQRQFVPQGDEDDRRG